MEDILFIFVVVIVIQFFWFSLAANQYKRTQEKRYNYWLGGFLGDKNLSVIKKIYYFLIITSLMYFAAFLIALIIDKK